MARSSFIITLILLLSSFTTAVDEGTYNSAFTGKKISETPFGDYIKEELPGDQMLMVVSYGCSHCWDATIAIDKLKKENLINTILVLGTGTADEKADFKTETKTDYKTTDYDFDALKEKLKASDPDFPPPPFAIWVHNIIIKTIFTEMPTPKQFKKLAKSS